MLPTTLNSNGKGQGIRKNYSRILEPMPFPNLIEVQLDSFQWFLKEGLKELFEEMPPIQSYGKHYELELGD